MISKQTCLDLSKAARSEIWHWQIGQTKFSSVFHKTRLIWFCCTYIHWFKVFFSTGVWRIGALRAGNRIDTECERRAAERLVLRRREEPGGSQMHADECDTYFKVCLKEYQSRVFLRLGLAVSELDLRPFSVGIHFRPRERGVKSQGLFYPSVLHGRWVDVPISCFKA